MLSRIRDVSFIFAVIALGGSVTAQARDWTAASVKGTVLMIVDGRWTEFDGRAVAHNSAIRTLQSGRLELESEGARISVGPNVALEIFTRPNERNTLIRQYSGSVRIDGGGSGPGLHLEAQDLQVAVIGGTAVSVSVTGEHATVKVERGTAQVTDMTTGSRVTAASGQGVDSNRPAVAVATGEKPGSTSGAGRGSDAGGGNANAGNGNAVGAGGNGGAGAGNGNAGAGGNNGNSGNGNGGSGGNSGNSGNGNGGSGGNNGNSGNGNGGSGGNSGDSGNGNGNNGNGNGNGGE